MEGARGCGQNSPELRHAVGTSHGWPIIGLPVILGPNYRMAVEFQTFSRLGAATKRLTRQAAAVMPTETHKAGA
jgi:hypothetical protein